MSSHEQLSAASNDRKARLAQLKSLKRKQAPSDDTNNEDSSPLTTASTTLTTTEEEPSVTTTYLSGRNFDPSTRNVKLGFENTPISNPENTLEYKAQQLALQTKAEQEKEKSDAPLDLFKLQPKKPNWDLKRDLGEKMRTGGLERESENAIARLVRERVEAQKREKQKLTSTGEGEEVGMEGGELVEAMNLREQEEERERARDAEDDAAVEG
ncbi:hypothetical protein SLS59_007410 [Nothophoma quercina]|uniref:Cwf18 pre-mRNA splicing factor n=1 Tax=Nothophoma quercina TaxID=749835 RepID=A0ABR3QZ00_9PLEO